MGTIPKTQRVVGVVCASGLVLASAGFGAVYAYRVGIEHSPLLAALSVLMALALEGVKPIAVSGAIAAYASWQVGRGVGLTVLGLVCITYSLTSELSLMATSRGDLVASRQASVDHATEVTDRRERLIRELDSLADTRPSEAITAQLDAILSDRRLKGCKTTLDKPAYRETCQAKVAPLKVELATAQRRTALQVELESLIGPHTTNTVSDPGSTSLATLLATFGIVVPVAVLAQWLTLVPVVALEVGSALALMVIAPQQVPVMAATAAFPTSTVAVGLPELGPTSALGTSREQASSAILNHLRASTDGTLAHSERGLAKLVGADRSTTRRAIRDLAQLGLVKIDQATKKGTVLRAI